MNNSNQLPSINNTTKLEFEYQRPILSSDLNEVQVIEASNSLASNRLTKDPIQFKYNIQRNNDDSTYSLILSDFAFDYVNPENGDVVRGSINRELSARISVENFVQFENVEICLWYRKREVNRNSKLYQDGFRTTPNLSDGVLLDSDSVITEIEIENTIDAALGQIDNSSLLSSRIITEYTITLKAPASIAIAPEDPDGEGSWKQLTDDFTCMVLPFPVNCEVSNIIGVVSRPEPSVNCRVLSIQNYSLNDESLYSEDYSSSITFIGIVPCYQTSDTAAIASINNHSLTGSIIRFDTLLMYAHQPGFGHGKSGICDTSRIFTGAGFGDFDSVDELVGMIYFSHNQEYDVYFDTKYGSHLPLSALQAAVETISQQSALMTDTDSEIIIKVHSLDYHESLTLFVSDSFNYTTHDSEKIVLDFSDCGRINSQFFDAPLFNITLKGDSSSFKIKNLRCKCDWGIGYISSGTRASIVCFSYPAAGDNRCGCIENCDIIHNIDHTKAGHFDYSLIHIAGTFNANDSSEILSTSINSRAIGYNNSSVETGPSDCIFLELDPLDKSGTPSFVVDNCEIHRDCSSQYKYNFNVVRCRGGVGVDTSYSEYYDGCIISNCQFDIRNNTCQSCGISFHTLANAKVVNTKIINSNSQGYTLHTPKYIGGISYYRVDNLIIDNCDIELVGPPDVYSFKFEDSISRRTWSFAAIAPSQDDNHYLSDYSHSEFRIINCDIKISNFNCHGSTLEDGYTTSTYGRELVLFSIETPILYFPAIIENCNILIDSCSLNITDLSVDDPADDTILVVSNIYGVYGNLQSLNNCNITIRCCNAMSDGRYYVDAINDQIVGVYNYITDRDYPVNPDTDLRMVSIESNVISILHDRSVDYSQSNLSLCGICMRVRRQQTNLSHAIHGVQHRIINNFVEIKTGCENPRYVLAYHYDYYNQVSSSTASGYHPSVIFQNCQANLIDHVVNYGESHLVGFLLGDRPGTYNYEYTPVNPSIITSPSIEIENCQVIVVAPCDTHVRRNIDGFSLDLCSAVLNNCRFTIEDRERCLDENSNVYGISGNSPLRCKGCTISFPIFFRYEEIIANQPTVVDLPTMSGFRSFNLDLNDCEVNLCLPCGMTKVSLLEPSRYRPIILENSKRFSQYHGATIRNCLIIDDLTATTTQQDAIQIKEGTNIKHLRLFGTTLAGIYSKLSAPAVATDCIIEFKPEPDCNNTYLYGTRLHDCLI